MMLRPKVENYRQSYQNYFEENKGLLPAAIPAMEMIHEWF